MGKSFKECLGKNGKLIRCGSQAVVDKHLYVDDGACSIFCLLEMRGIIEGKRPSDKEKLEVAQWVYEKRPESSERIKVFLESAGIKLVGQYKGRWLYDELYAGNFIMQSGHYYYLLGMYNTHMSTGHVILVYQSPKGDNWLFYDPNFGTASFPTANGCLLAIKNVMQNIYPQYGPYFPFVIRRFSP